MTIPPPHPLLSSSDEELKRHTERVLGSLYELDREIGRGGMGIVYRGFDRRLKRAVAIKILPPELGFRSEIRLRFLKEAETAAQLSHPHIVPIYSVDERERLVFFVMACVEGVNIAQRMRMQGAFSADETRRVLTEVADALGYAHGQGVIHRDIKPDNIILDLTTGRAMVTDFGIARAGVEAESRLTATGVALGTPAFMSPEQCMGEREIDGRSDLYSLGVVGYQMLCGELPFAATNTPALLMRHISAVPRDIAERVPGLPKQLAAVIMTLLEKDPANRFASAGELTDALNGGPVPQRQQRTRTEPGGRGFSGEAEVIPEDSDSYVPSAEDLTRWNAGPVGAFRRKLVMFVPVNLVIVVFSLFAGEGGFVTLSLLWSIYMAFQYGGLWSQGYDWRDVLRFPRHRTLLDLTSEAIDDVGALTTPEKRRQLRERARLRGRYRKLRGESTPAESKPGARGVASSARRDGGASGAGQSAAVVRANEDRAEIVRLLGVMPRKERKRLADVLASANELHSRIASLSLAQPGRSSAGTGGAEALMLISSEIRTLEDNADPFDSERAEQRVRRLAFLRRQHRQLHEEQDVAALQARKLEECCIALHNIRLDLSRLRGGTASLENLTTLAQRAISLAGEVDGAIARTGSVDLSGPGEPRPVPKPGQ